MFFTFAFVLRQRENGEMINYFSLTLRVLRERVRITVWLLGEHFAWLRVVRLVVLTDGEPARVDEQLVADSLRARGVGRVASVGPILVAICVAVTVIQVLACAHVRRILVPHSSLSLVISQAVQTVTVLADGRACCTGCIAWCVSC